MRTTVNTKYATTALNGVPVLRSILPKSSGATPSRACEKSSLGSAIAPALNEVSPALRAPRLRSATQKGLRNRAPVSIRGAFIAFMNSKSYGTDEMNTIPTSR